MNMLCIPGILFLIYGFVDVINNIIKRKYNDAIINFIITIIVTMIINMFCINNMGVFSWAILRKKQHE